MTIGMASAANAHRKDGYRNVMQAKLRKMNQGAEANYVSTGVYGRADMVSLNGGRHFFIAFIGISSNGGRIEGHFTLINDLPHGYQFHFRTTQYFYGADVFFR